MLKLFIVSGVRYVYVRLIITDIETEETNISGTFMIRITESELKVPNAFRLMTTE